MTRAFNSKLFGEVALPADFEQLMKLLLKETSGESPVRHWRGQSDIDEPIHSDAARRLLLSGKHLSENNLVHYEKGLLKRAEHKGFRQLRSRTLSDLELLAGLQAHGAAIRLVLFSRNALVALWFCCSSEPKKTGLLLGIDVNDLGGYEMNLEKGSYEQVVKDLGELDYPMTWEPPAISKRLSAQHTQFLYSAYTDSRQGSLRLSKKEEANLFIAVKPELKMKVLVVLEAVFDIRAYTLFPDLNGFSCANRADSDPNNMFRW